MEKTERAITLYQAGYTLREVATQVGASAETIRRILIRAGVTRRPRGLRPSPGRRITDKDGYVLVRKPEHPFANSTGYVREHRLVMERSIGRHLTPDEVVHHIDGNKANNSSENLQLFASNSDHKRVDMAGNIWAKGDFGNPKRRYRVRRNPHQILMAICWLAASLDRPIRRKDLAPPHPSHRAVARAFGSWQAGVAIALSGGGASTTLRASPLESRTPGPERHDGGQRQPDVCALTRVD
jgi:hypothetical protein